MVAAFKCHGCGACCLALGAVLAASLDEIEESHRQQVAEFPYKATDDGRCEKLGDDMKCTVYENRPPLCRVDDHYKNIAKNTSKEDYLAKVTDACKFLMQHALGMSKQEIKDVYATL